MTPLYDGSPIFGTACRSATGSPPRAADLTSTFGLDGIGRQDGGSRGMRSIITGTLFGLNSDLGYTGPGSLAFLEGTCRSYADGQARAYTDSLGTTWPDVILESFTPQGRVGQTPAGLMFRRFTAVLLHLS